MVISVKNQHGSFFLWFFFILFAPFITIAAIPDFRTQPPKGLMDRVLSINVGEKKGEDGHFETIVHVLGNGKFPEFVTRALDSPPKLIFDILSHGEPFDSMYIKVQSNFLSGVRIGYHEKKIRLVMDVKTENIPNFTTTSFNNTLIISLRSRRPENGKERKGEQEGIGDTGPGDGKPTSQVNSSPQVANSARIKEKDEVAEGELSWMVADDGKEETRSFLRALGAYRAKNWQSAIESLDQFLKIEASGTYTERANFMLATAHKRLSSSSKFNETKRRYEEIINRFPNSKYIAAALLDVGEMNFANENYYEALGYYNLVIKKDKDSLLAFKAFMQKINMLVMKKKFEEALPISEYLVRKYPNPPEVTLAKIKMAKILYEMDRFSKSLRIFNDVKTANPKEIFRHPEILLYLGFNYYELGENIKARENLFRAYNGKPEINVKHKILTKIGDTYRNEGLIESAVKIYRLNLERYIDTEGAIFSLFRLAELQEKGELEIKRSAVSFVKSIELGAPREIYEKIMNNLMKKDRKNPLVQLALLKLAILYQKEQDYRKSLETLKDLLEKYPLTTLRKEIAYTLGGTLGFILKEEMEQKRYTNIVNLYEREKAIFSMVEDPELFLAVGRASSRLRFEGLATQMFQRADHFLKGRKKPADLLMSLSQDLFKKEKLQEASTRLGNLIKDHPTDKHISSAYYLRGKIYLKQKKYSQAEKMLSYALKFERKPCEKVNIFLDRSRSFAAANQKKKALAAVRKADRSKMTCRLSKPWVYEDIGRLLLDLGDPTMALKTFNRALELEAEPEDHMRIKLMIAQCYKVLNRKEDYIALYDQILNTEDSFWSQIAKERMEGMNFNRDFKKAKEEESKGDTIQR